MKHIFIHFLLLCLYCFPLFIEGQSLSPQKVLSIDRKNSKNLECLPVVSEEGNFTFYMISKPGIQRLRMRPDFKITGRFNTPFPESKFRTLLGYTQTPAIQHLYFTTAKNNQLLVQSFIVGKSIQRHKIFDLKFKKEKYLTSMVHDNAFYLVTIKKHSSSLKVYVFEKDQLSFSKDFDFGDQVFNDHPDFPQMYSAITIDGQLVVANIDLETPTPLAKAITETKFYFDHDQKIHLTLDNYLNKTHLITLDLTNGDKSLKVIPKSPMGCADQGNLQTNSFFDGQVLYQIQVCSSAISLQVVNPETIEVLSKYSASEDQDISFRNTDIWQNGGRNTYTQNTNKALNKTRQTLKRMSQYNVGVSAFQHEGLNILNIGSSVFINNATPIVVGTGFGPGGGPTTTINSAEPMVHSFSYNSVFSSLSGFSASRIIDFKTLLNNRYEHEKVGEIPIHPFEEISAFEKRLKNYSSQSAYKLGENYVYVYFDNKVKKLVFLKF